MYEKDSLFKNGIMDNDMKKIQPDNSIHYLNMSILKDKQKEMYTYVCGTKTNKIAAEKTILKIIDGFIDCDMKFHWVSSPEKVEPLYNNIIKNEKSINKKFHNVNNIVHYLRYYLRRCNEGRMDYSIVSKVQDSICYWMYYDQVNYISCSNEGILNIFDKNNDPYWIKKSIMLYPLKDYEMHETCYNLLTLFDELVSNCFQVYIMHNDIIMVENPLRYELKKYINDNCPYYRVIFP